MNAKQGRGNGVKKGHEALRAVPGCKYRFFIKKVKVYCVSVSSGIGAVKEKKKKKFLKPLQPSAMKEETQWDGEVFLSHVCVGCRCEWMSKWTLRTEEGCCCGEDTEEERGEEGGGGGEGGKKS